MEQLSLTPDPQENPQPKRWSGISTMPKGGGRGRVKGKSPLTLVKLGGVLLVVMLWSTAWVMNARAEEQIQQAAAVSVERYPYITKSVEVVEGSTFGTLMADAGVSGSDAGAILSSAEEVYDLSRVRLGRTIDLLYDRESGDFLRLNYQIDSEEILEVVKGEEGWVAERVLIPYEVEVRTVEGDIESSLYVSALEQDLDERAIIGLAEVFQWEIDFTMDVRVGDSYKFIFEERYLDGQYVMPGSVLAAKFVNNGRVYYGFRHEDSDGEVGYYNEEGESVEKFFLKAPVAFKYISSGFTTGRRYISAFNVSTGHRAIDYAAPTGTPIRAVGNGTITYAGWNGPYGKYVRVRHNSTYTTQYGHMSRIAVRNGQKVNQGDTIGYVGSTGFSTGPHLHYEMVKYGTKINPLREEFPSTEPIPSEQMESYLEQIAPLRGQLDVE
jgi:murein DD-endopeptidase MepM/ murein hydrolase activator NlpD